MLKIILQARGQSAALQRNDTLKIDRSFIRDLINDPDDMSLVCSIIDLAHSFRLTVIAEGVETQAQEDILRVEGCDFAQGYYYARPALPANYATGG